MNSKDIRTVNDIFNYLGYATKYDAENFCLRLTDTGFINYIDDESIFYCSNYNREETFYFGEIIVEFSNTIKDAQKILSLFERLTKQYSTPAVNFAKDIYLAFRNMGYSDLVTRCILYGVLYSLCLNSNLQDFNYREFFYLWVITNPLKSITQNHFTDEAITTVTFLEDENKELQLCYSNLDSHSLKALDTIYARKNNVTFHQCLHCSGYFIETNANNLKYCPTCRNVHSDLKSDVFRKAYRTAYKTMQARAKRYEDKGNDFNDYVTRYIAPFEIDAKSKLDTFRNNNDLVGYQTFLNQLKEKHKPVKE